MTFERKMVRGGILVAGAFAIAVAVVALREQGGRTPQAWMAVAAALAVIASLTSALGTHKVLELQEDALEPAIRVTLDFRRRYQLAQLSVSNGGGSHAYDVRIKWDNPLLTVDGDEAQVCGPTGALPVLLARDEATFLLGQSHQFLEKYPNATWSGTVSYENASGERKRKPFSMTAEHERLALVHNEEAPKTQFELQKIPDRLEAIAGELARIRRLLEAKKTDLTNPKEIEAVLRGMTEATKDGA